MIFYYTATGNSLYIAKNIDKNILSIPQVLKQEKLDYQDDSIGIVAPIYAGELPKTVRRFIERATFKTDYFYLVLTYGKDDTVAGKWSEQFCLNNGIKVNSIQTIKMVDNYLPSFDMEEEMEIDKKIDQQLKEIIKNIQTRKQSIPKISQEAQKIYETVTKRFQEHSELIDGSLLQMTDRCVGCSICKQVCPIGNIKIENNQAKRINQTCDFCLACIQNCPFNAIDLQSEKNPKARYRHPQITLKDIVKSNKQGE